MGTKCERKDMGTQDWHFSPLPKGTSRAIHHPKAEGGWAMVDPGTRAGMAGQGTRATVASPPPRTWPQPLPRPLRLEPFYPQKKFLGGSWGWFGLALGRRGHLGALWRCGHLRTVPRSGLWRALWRRRHSKLILKKLNSKIWSKFIDANW